MRRREFIALIGGTAAAWPLAARAQQPAMPVVGFLASLSSASVAHFTPAFRAGLSETGYIDGQNVLIEFRSAEGQYDRLAALAAEVVDRKVAVIVAAGGSEPAKVAKAATATIPIVFVSAADPVRAGVVISFNRPGGNITGVSLLGSALETKRLELLHEMVLGASPIGVLLNPKYPDFDLELRELQDAANVINRKIIVVRASTQTEVDAAFTMITQQAASALLVAQEASISHFDPSATFSLIACGASWASFSSPAGRNVLGLEYCTKQIFKGHMQRSEFITPPGGTAAVWSPQVRNIRPSQLRIGCGLVGHPLAD
jgi:ABC-type uncharacterized transport system substrate-binding protein